MLNSWSNTGYHDVEEKIEGHKSYCKVKEVIDCSICGHYKVLSSKTNTHIRGSKCSKCGEYYPTFEEEAEEKIEQSKGEYNNGNEIQKGAEGDEEIAEGDFIEGLETYQDADDEYEDVLSDLDEAGKLNDLVDEYMENLRKEIIYYGDAIEGFETEQYSSIYSQNKVGINIKDSEIEFDEVQEDKTIAEKISEDARQLYRDIMNFEEVNTDFLLEKNLEVNSGLDADPVKYTTGEYVSKSTDLIIDNISPELRIIRNYSNFEKESFSFGQGWNFNYDTRIIVGVKPDYEEYYDDMNQLFSEIEAIYDQANENYQKALEYAKEGILLAEQAVEEAEMALQYARAAKEAAQKAKDYADTAEGDAGLVLEYTEEAARNINRAISHATSARSKAVNARTYAESARDLAKNARGYAQKAVSYAETALDYANQSGEQDIIEQANYTLERAENLLTRVKNTINNTDGNPETGEEGLIKKTEKLKEDCQALLDLIANTGIENSIAQEEQRALQNIDTAREKQEEAEELLSHSETAEILALNTLNDANELLDDAGDWKNFLEENISIIQ
ncbi:MAG TPA: DUF6531 domain-containing protein, partial [Halanaerobiales bacterium]|nr:DUF6531 domain-containing protein [Halanaerobiales bacterium]